jgi:hypothetical protein
MSDQKFALRLHTAIADIIRAICLELLSELQVDTLQSLESSW